MLIDKIREKFSVKDVVVLYVIFSALAISLFDYRGDIAELFGDLRKIASSPYGLVNDYISNFGRAAAFFNAAITTLLWYIAIRLFKKETNDLAFASLMILFGFSLIGKNIFTTLPIMTGVLLAAKYKKTTLGNFIIVGALLMSLSPVSHFLWAYAPQNLGLNQTLGIVLGIFAGIASGFVGVVFAIEMPKLHKGLTIYNIGFTIGIIAMILNFTLQLFGVVNTQIMEDFYHQAYLTYKQMNFSFQWVIFYWLLTIPLVTLISSLFLSRQNHRDIFKVWTQSGYDPKFSDETNEAAVMFSVGIMMIFAIIVGSLLGVRWDGLSIAGVVSFGGFSAYGKHPLNTLPIMAGVGLAAIVVLQVNPDYPERILYSRFMFGAALAPIVGIYGWKSGVLAGFLHVTITNRIIAIHMFGMYHNGFGTGLVALTMIGFFALFKIQPKHKIKKEGT